MNNKILATLGTAAFALGLSATASYAQIISQPGETMGVALGAPLPEGVFFVDLESYGKTDGSPSRLGVNIPLVAWSTPFSFYDTRLEVLYAAPFTHVDGAIGNRVDSYSQALLVGGAHSFGNGFNLAVFAGVRPEDNFTNATRGTGADLRASLSYVANGINATLTFAYSGDFGGEPGFNDNVYVDYTLTKKFDKLEVGLVGYAQTDLDQGFQTNGFGGQAIHRSVAVGGLVGYDFGRFTLQGMVTREVANGPYGGYSLGTGKETRGWVRLIVPLYVAPAAPALVRARY
jgi:hypothetical protein